MWILFPCLPSPTLRYAKDMKNKTSALHGLKVLDLSRVLAGPWASQMLGDMGAEVIKIEHPKGDDTRQWGPPFIGKTSAYFACVNRNKKSVAVNLKTAAGQKIIHDLAKDADVVIENFRSGDAEELNIGYEQLKAVNPDIVYCSISGYGRTGSRKNDPGYDLLAQSETGVMHITGEVDGQPSKVGVAIVDITTGMNAAFAILAALRHRDSGHGGQHIDISLFDSGLQWLANVASNTLFTGEDAKRLGNAHPSIVPYETFTASDGYFTLCCGNDHQWAHLCRAIGQESWIDSDDYGTNPKRVQNRMVLIPALNAIFRQHPREYWIEKLGDDLPVGKVNTVKEALETPTTTERGMKISLKNSTGDHIPMLGSPINMSETDPVYTTAPPAVGEHTAEVLKSLGYDKTAIATLVDNGTVKA